jgi:hypothetical protein
MQAGFSASAFLVGDHVRTRWHKMQAGFSASAFLVGLF